MDAESRSTRDNAVRLCHMEPVRLPLRHAAQSPPQLPDPLHRMAKAHSHRPPDILPRNPCEDRSESIEAILRKRWILFVGSVARMEDARLPKRVMFGIPVGCAVSTGSRERMNGVSPGRPQGFRHRGVKRKNEWCVSWTTSEFSASTPTSGRSQPRTRGNGLGPLNKGRNASWRNGSR